MHQAMVPDRLLGVFSRLALGCFFAPRWRLVCCCQNDGSEQQAQLACKDNTNIKDEKVLKAELKNSSRVIGGWILFGIVLVAFVLPLFKECKCENENSCCFNKTFLYEKLIIIEEGNVLEQVLRNTAKEKLTEGIKSKIRDEKWEECFDVAGTLIDPRRQVEEKTEGQGVYKWCHFLCDLDHSVMGTQLYLGVIVVTLFATTVANAEIKVQCEKDSISITLTIPSRLRQYAARYFLGNCMPSRFNVLPSGEGKAEFNYKLADCNFKRLMKGKHLIYKNELTFRPRPRSSPAAYVYPIECVYPRPKGWVPPFLNPGSGVAEGRGGLKCLLDSVKGNSRFLPRYHSSAIILYLQSFKFGLGEEVKIWELLDDPMQSSMCDCCSRTCNTRSKRGDEWESNGFWHTSVLGPLIIMDPSQQNAHNASEVSIADQDHSVMGTQLYLGVIVVTLFATTVANAGMLSTCM
ncbi:hypothetical protein F7725_001265 [Dissostichus mawsoni]|uniref:ZP domain-containing protein n=1 Tax=Dissostichus mawsoni TaxID=36200 RepID=A0A7J5ZH83_DISMA|nr:hypothetical protein F7725_001265 [Dissostichus mawsoni]